MLPIPSKDSRLSDFKGIVIPHASLACPDSLVKTGGLDTDC